MSDLKKTRQILPWMLLNCGAVLVLCYITSFGGFFEQLSNLQTRAPAIRLTTLSFVILFVTALAILMPIILILKSIPIGEKLVKKLVFTFNTIAFSGFGLMILLMASSTLLQNHFMPPMGYIRCDSLHGSQSIWSTDWVNASNLCVHGRTLEWANEQARKVQALPATQ